MLKRDVSIILLLVIAFCIAGIGLVSAQANETATAEKQKSGGLCLPGFSGWDCSLVWIVAILLFFLAAIFRKNVANDLLDMPFSLVGASILGEVAYIISLLILHQIKWGMLIGIAGVLIGGFVLNFFGDVESGSGE